MCCPHGGSEKEYVVLFVESIKPKHELAFKLFLRSVSFKMKTVSAAVVVCLNLSMDPPGITKGTEWSRIESWFSEWSIGSHDSCVWSFIFILFIPPYCSKIIRL